MGLLCRLISEVNCAFNIRGFCNVHDLREKRETLDIRMNLLYSKSNWNSILVVKYTKWEGRGSHIDCKIEVVDFQQK